MKQQKSKQRLILLDIDGTLYDNKNSRIPPSTIAAIRRLKDLGKHELAIATGRAPFMLGAVAEILPLFDYFVMINGQYITDREHVVYRQPLDTDRFLRLITGLRQRKIAYGFESAAAHALSASDPLAIAAFAGLALALPPVNPDFFTTHDIYQGWMFCKRPQARLVAADYPEFTFIRWMDVGYDILPVGASKGLGMKKLADYLQIAADNIIAIGDGDNDFEMIRDAGIGVAMGNATGKVKAVADLVTDDVGADGLYKAFKRLGLAE